MAASKLHGDQQSAKYMGNPSHLSGLSSGLNELRQQEIFCDVTIIVGDQRFPAHKAVLTSASDYFQRMFSAGFMESNMNEVTVSAGTAESFAEILNFLYTGYFTLSKGTVVGILEMACYLVLDEAVELCVNYLQEIQCTFDIEDIFELWFMACDQGNLPNIAKICWKYIVQEFPKCVCSRIFLENFPTSSMMEILGDEEIETDTMTEEQLLEDMMSWLKYDWEHRKCHAVNLLKKIRLGLVPVDRLHQIFGDELLSIPECKDMVETVVKLSVTKDTATPPLNKSHPDLFSSRNTVTAAFSVVFDKTSPMCSITCRDESGCYELTNVADIEEKLPHLRSDVRVHAPDGRCSAAIDIFVTDTGHIYVLLCQQFFKSMSIGSASANFLRYDFGTNEWVILPPMPQLPIYTLSPVIFKFIDKIYLIDEGDLRGIFIQKYSILWKTWDVVFNDPEVVIINHTQYVGNKVILIVYGVKVEGPNLEEDEAEQGGVIETRVAVYNTTTDKWVEVTFNTTVDHESRFINFENKWYMTASQDGREICTDWIKQCICDFDSESPSVVVGKEIEEGELYSRILKQLRETWYSNRYTFDKRKIGMKKISCKCDNHTK